MTQYDLGYTDGRAGALMRLVERDYLNGFRDGQRDRCTAGQDVLTTPRTVYYTRYRAHPSDMWEAPELSTDPIDAGMRAQSLLGQGNYLKAQVSIETAVIGDDGNEMALSHRRVGWNSTRDIARADADTPQVVAIESTAAYTGAARRFLRQSAFKVTFDDERWVCVVASCVLDAYASGLAAYPARDHHAQWPDGVHTCGRHMVDGGSVLYCPACEPDAGR